MQQTMTWIHRDQALRRDVAPGFAVYDLWRGPDGRLARLIEIAPGARYPRTEIHEPGPKECFVVSGVFSDGFRDYPAGTFVHNPAGSRQVPQSAAGCVLFLFYPEG